MSATGRTFYIAGAGIAGLTLALALAKFGAKVVVLERNPAVSEFGAGLQISPNARRVLNQLGLDSALAAASLEPEAINVFPFGHAEPLVSLTLGSAIRRQFGEPYAVMHRADLAEALYKTCRRFANIDIVFNVGAWTASAQADGVAITLEQGNGSTRNGRAFALIGADGVHSQTRTQLLSGPAAKYTGRAAWRALVPMDLLKHTLATDRTALMFAPGLHMVAYPLPHRGQFNIALFDPLKLDLARSATPPAAPELPAAIARDPRFGAILAAAADGWSFWPLYAVQTDHWSNGPIGLIGDAAHAMEPFQAQGAAMGIEDAAILAPLLMSTPDAASAFARYQLLRRSRVARVARTSHANGNIFHLGWPWAIGRNLVMRAQGPTAHFQRLRWLYGYDAAAHAAT